MAEMTSMKALLFHSVLGKHGTILLNYFPISSTIIAQLTRKLTPWPVKNSC